MIWSSFKTVVYPRDFFSLSASCTSRTVEGPRNQRTRRISSSDVVGFCGERVMAGPYYEEIRSVNENLRRSNFFARTPGQVAIRVANSREPSLFAQDPRSSGHASLLVAAHVPGGGRLASSLAMRGMTLAGAARKHA